MQFSKPMIELVYAIRRSAPAALKPSIKLANPQLFEELAAYYHTEANTVSRALIKELCTLAGEPWSRFLDSPPDPPQPASVKVYRGQTGHHEKTDRANAGDKDKPRKPKRIYRGRVVAY